MMAVGSAGLAGLSALVAEGALHIWNRADSPDSVAEVLARQTGTAWERARITAADGVPLEAWLFTPRQANGGAVIALHGVGDTRLGMMGHAGFLVRDGFAVLVPDCRGHGASGGTVIGYGVREAEDMHRWADWLMARPGVTRLYGIGQSMGAAILLQTLPREPRFRAMVADCPFDTFEEVAGDRLAQRGAVGRVLAWPVVHLGFWYARARYGLDLSQASPDAAVRRTRVPVLLIHGTRDDNIVPRHSRELHAANPGATRLWLVEGAGHVESLGTAPEEYRREVTAWFSR
jgi:pimeloyl-ACP methyl ester carboxylesterase